MQRGFKVDFLLYKVDTFRTHESEKENRTKVHNRGDSSIRIFTGIATVNAVAGFDVWDG